MPAARALATARAPMSRLWSTTTSAPAPALARTRSTSPTPFSTATSDRTSPEALAAQARCDALPTSIPRQARPFPSMWHPPRSRPARPSRDSGTHITRPWRTPPGTSPSAVRRGPSATGGNTPPRPSEEAGTKGHPAAAGRQPLRDKRIVPGTQVGAVRTVMGRGALDRLEQAISAGLVLADEMAPQFKGTPAPNRAATLTVSTQPVIPAHMHRRYGKWQGSPSRPERSRQSPLRLVKPDQQLAPNRPG